MDTRHMTDHEFENHMRAKRGLPPKGVRGTTLHEIFVEDLKWNPEANKIMDVDFETVHGLEYIEPVVTFTTPTTTIVPGNCSKNSSA